METSTSLAGPPPTVGKLRANYSKSNRKMKMRWSCFSPMSGWIRSGSNQCSPSHALRCYRLCLLSSHFYVCQVYGCLEFCNFKVFFRNLFLKNLKRYSSVSRSARLCVWFCVGHSVQPHMAPITPLYWRRVSATWPAWSAGSHKSTSSELFVMS